MLLFYKTCTTTSNSEAHQMRQNLRLAKWKEAAGSSEAASLFVRPQTRRRFSLFFFSFFFWEDTDDNDNQYHHPLSLASFSTTTPYP